MLQSHASAKAAKSASRKSHGTACPNATRPSSPIAGITRHSGSTSASARTRLVPRNHAVRRIGWEHGIRATAARSLWLDSGDAFQGAPVFNIFKGEAEYRALSLAGMDGAVIGKGTPDEIKNSPSAYLKQFVNALPDGPVRFHFPGPTLEDDLRINSQGPSSPR